MIINTYDDNKNDDNQYDDNKYGLMASFWMASSSIGGLTAKSWMASLSSEFDDFAYTDLQSIITKSADCFDFVQMQIFHWIW